ncbi:hypothetical protein CAUPRSCDRAFT_11871 [Caulochytrium protostelioides]|nr:hypothetical protein CAUPRSCDRAFT_11871 [Caulochytrium protostelioides]
MPRVAGLNTRLRAQALFRSVFAAHLAPTPAQPAFVVPRSPTPPVPVAPRYPAARPPPSVVTPRRVWQWVDGARAAAAPQTASARRIRERLARGVVPYGPFAVDDDGTPAVASAAASAAASADGTIDSDSASDEDAADALDALESLQESMQDELTGATLARLRARPGYLDEAAQHDQVVRAYRHLGAEHGAALPDLLALGQSPF